MIFMILLWRKCVEFSEDLKPVCEQNFLDKCLSWRSRNTLVFYNVENSYISTLVDGTLLFSKGKFFPMSLIISLHLDKKGCSQNLFVESQQLKNKKNLWNLFKVQNKGTRLTIKFLTFFWRVSPWSWTRKCRLQSW